MKKDNLPVWPSDTNKGGSKSIEVFFLGEPKKVEKNTETDEGETFKGIFISKGKINPLGKHAFKEACDILSNAGATDSEVDGFLQDAAAVGSLEIQSLIEELNGQDVNENSAGEGEYNHSLHCCPVGSKGHTGWKGIKIDDTIPSDFVSTEDLVLGEIYKIVALKLTVKFVGQIMIPTNKTLIQVSRHGILLYLDEGSLIKATQLEVEYYMNDNPF